MNRCYLLEQQLQNVGAALENLQKTCAEMRKHVSASRVETAPVIDEANTLITQREQVKTKQSILDAFNDHFLLTDEELVALTSTAEPVDDEYFQTLVKAKTIQKDCEVLLSTENQRLGVEILDESNKHLNAAFQKLYRWTLREFKSLDLENPQMSFSIRRALRVLAERPTLFQSCLDTFAESREHSLSDSFYAALSGATTENELQRPIEFSAHEPLRYVGDMLAWAHSTAVSEREALEALFISDGNEIAKSIQAGLESEPWLRPDTGEAFDGRTALSQLINRSLAGVALLLRQRVEQVVRMHDEPVLAYKIANLVVFYRNIFRKLLKDGGFTATLDAMEGAAIERFKSTMRFQTDSAEREQAVAPEALGAPEELEEALEQLKALLQSYDTSVATSDPDGEALDLVLSEALDPFLECCACLSTPMTGSDSHVFPINCLLAAKATLSDFSFTDSKISDLNSLIQQHAIQLAESQYNWLLQHSGLRPLVSALQDLPELDDISDNPGTIHESPEFAPQSLAAARQQLDEFLPSALTGALENVKRLTNSTLAHQITDRAVARFCADFSRVETAVIAIGPSDASAALSDGEEEDREPNPRELFPRTTEEIRILLAS